MRSFPGDEPLGLRVSNLRVQREQSGIAAGPFRLPVQARGRAREAAAPLQRLNTTIHGAIGPKDRMLSTEESTEKERYANRDNALIVAL